MERVMQVQAGSGSTATTTAGTAPTRPAQQFDFMKLIVAQMKNMNPMDPNSGGDSLGTMMQAESLNQLTLLNRALKDMQTMSQTSYASSLIGRTVTGVDEGNTTVGGIVRAVKIEATGPVLELSTGKRLRLLDVTEAAAA
jgi:flagellar basal-body rod modification protein FlgD